MSDELNLLARAIERLNDIFALPHAHYLEFTGGSLDGKEQRMRGADIVDDYYHSYDIRGEEKTVVERYTLSGKIYIGDDLPDGQKTVYYPFAYVSEEVSGCPLAGRKKRAWEI